MDLRFFAMNIEMIVLFLVSIAIVLNSFLTTDAINDMNQILFLFIIIFVVAPLIFIKLNFKVITRFFPMPDTAIKISNSFQIL